MRHDDACPRFLGFAKGWEGNWSANSTCFLSLYSAKASKHWVLAPSALSSRLLTSINLLITCANALLTRSMKGAKGGMAGDDVIARRGLEAKGVGLGFPIGY